MQKSQSLTLVDVGYYSALFTGGLLMLILVLALINGFVQSPVLAICSQGVWLGLISSGIGLFASFAARTDLQGAQLDPTVANKLKLGWRYNLIFFIMMAIITLGALALLVSGRLVPTN